MKFTEDFNEDPPKVFFIKTIPLHPNGRFLQCHVCFPAEWPSVRSCGLNPHLIHYICGIWSSLYVGNWLPWREKILVGKKLAVLVDSLKICSAERVNILFSWLYYWSGLSGLFGAMESSHVIACCTVVTSSASFRTLSGACVEPKCCSIDQGITVALQATCTQLCDGQ